MNEAGEALSPRERRDESEEVLRAKYLDYCSAQVSDILLLLSPDEMYVLAQDAAASAELPGELSYDQIVQLATERLTEKLSLPPFHVWLEDYRANPGSYERHMLGLWESEI